MNYHYSSESKCRYIFGVVLFLVILMLISYSRLLGILQKVGHRFTIFYWCFSEEANPSFYLVEDLNLEMTMMHRTTPYTSIGCPQLHLSSWKGPPPLSRLPQADHLSVIGLETTLSHPAEFFFHVNCVDAVALSFYGLIFAFFPVF